MDSKAGCRCAELYFEGQQLCKSGRHSDGVKRLEQAVKVGTNDYEILTSLYNQLGNSYVFLGDLVSAARYYQLDRTLARSVGDLSVEGTASGNLANTLKTMGKYDEAIVCGQRQMEIAKELSDKAGEAKALYSIANAYHLKGKRNCEATPTIGKQNPDAVVELNIALKFYTQYLAIVKDLGNKPARGKVCGSIGNCYYLLGNCAEAVKFHTERLAIAKEFGDKEAERRAYTNLGNCHILMGEFQQAIDFYLQTLHISRLLSDLAFEAQACYSLGSTYIIIGDYNRGIEYHLRHKQIAMELKDRVGLGRACWMLSNAHALLGNHKKALEYTEEQFKISTESGDEAGKATAEKNRRVLTTLLDSSKPGVSRVRRSSMENMQILSLTPEQAQTNTKTQRQSKEGVRKPLFDGQPPPDLRSDDGADASRSGSNSLAHNGHNGVINVNDVRIDVPSRGLEVGGLASSDHFFDLLQRLQGHRMNDQRAEMRDDDMNVLPAFLQLPGNGNHVPIEGNGVAANEQENQMSEQEQEEQQERMNQMMSMLARSQSKRLNEQRVSLPSPPSGSQENLNQMDSGPPAEAEQVLEIENNIEPGDPNVLDDIFLENLMRCQSTRLNDQRSAAPSTCPTLTIPEEDFFSLIMRMQSSRIDDQRCHFGPETA